MHAFSGRTRRKSDVVPLFNVSPAPPSTPSTPQDTISSSVTNGSANGLGFATRRLSRIKPMSWSQRNVIPEGGSSVAPHPLSSAGEEGDDEDPHEPHKAQATQPAQAPTTATTLPRLPSGKSAKKLSQFAQSVISMNRQQLQQQRAKKSDNRRDDQHQHSDNDDTEEHPNDETRGIKAATSSSTNQSDGHDPWGHVLDKVMRKTAPTSKRVSLSQMMQRREVKDLVTQAVIANHWTESANVGVRPHSSHGATNGSPTARSSVMEHWMKTSVLRNANPLQRINANGDDSEFEDDSVDQDARDGIKSGFDVRDTGFGAMYGRTLLLEESCRRAFAQSGENRSQMDLQALKAWFQMTKLKITTDFERLQPAELDLLCRRMALVHLHANEIVFRQGDEGDAMYIVFAGCVEVKVAQRILGEKVEVTVCELSKGDYFGERALLHDDPRAATIVAKTACELVKITRKDYTIMLKQDQQEFYSRMQLAGSVATGGIGSIVGGGLNGPGGTTNPSLILPRSRSMLHQQTQLEYVNVLTKKKHTRTKSDIDMLSEYLQTLKFFRGLPRTFVRELCSVIDFQTLPASAYVFREGEVGDLFYIIFSGSVDVIVSSKDFRGNEQQTKLINLTEGAHFGELALMKGHGIRSATVLTREETRFLVICEKDYNSTLRRMQKEDLAKRVGVLDRIPMFQTPEWTGDLLKEMSYVLSEQKLATGSVLFRQGEKAQQVYFVVRGELLVTKEIVDPGTNQINVVFVERIGRDRVVGDDAAAGANFNEVIYREVTVTASTPVELLVLSKYDVFHRLSRSARETLRAAAQSHVESVVYLDRYHKTVKWDAYKRKLLDENLNHERMRKLLPAVETATAAARSVKKPKTPRSTTTSEPSATTPPADGTSAEPTPTLSTLMLSGSDAARTTAKTERELVAEEVRTILATQSQLVDANEFLLLQPVDATISDCFPANKRTIAHHVSSFNADAPPRTQTRDRQLRRALNTERRRRIEVLNEGNPLAYFDLDVVQAQQRQQQAEVRGRAASSRRLLMRKRPSGGTGGAAGAPAPAPATSVKSQSAEATATNVMNQFFQDNFIFSHPEKPVRCKSEQSRRLRLLQELEQRHGLRSGEDNEDDESAQPQRTTEVVADAPSGKPAIRVDEARRSAEMLCQGDWVVVDVMSSVETDGGIGSSRESPRFRILRCAESLEVAKATMVNYTQRCGDDDSSDDEGNSEPPALFAIMKKRFALLPRATRPRVTEEALQRVVASKFLRPSYSPAVSVTHSTAPTANASSASELMASVFASFQKLALTVAEQRDHATAIANSKQAKNSEVAIGTQRSKLFAIVSVVLSKRELETAFCEEPFICIHALLPTEAEAMDQALHMPPQALKNALLCVLPVGEWIHFEDAYDFCVQIEPDRRDKHPTTVAAGAATVSASPMRRRTGSIASGIGLTDPPSPSTAKADWQIDKEKARRLHHFVCTRLGLKPLHDKDRRGGNDAGPPVTGFTPRPTVTLDQKLATLQDYLDTTAQSTMGAKGSTSMLGKYRQMKRFGSILRSRVSTSTNLAATAALLVNTAGSPTIGTS